jgi:endonuclease YncB( thermonuclease family)
MGMSGASVVALVGLVVAGSIVAAAVTDDARGSTRSRTVVTRVVDGDTVEIASGKHVRLIGVDTPERGTCGYDAATGAMQQMVESRTVVLVNPDSVQDLDTYGRLLRFVDVGGRDAGFAQISSGRGKARYDSRDGYDPHPREDRYHRADRQHAGACEG